MYMVTVFLSLIGYIAIGVFAVLAISEWNNSLLRRIPDEQKDQHCRNVEWILNVILPLGDVASVICFALMFLLWPITIIMLVSRHMAAVSYMRCNLIF